jgi:hypothetical protein
MDLEQMRRRPLLTVLSGPAAGVAGALMSERVSEGVFLETGGTSTDISVIRRGKVSVRHAEIGGYRTFLNSLDVRTVGIGGGSLIRVRNGRVTEVGPRSAHIAGLAYACYADPAALAGATLVNRRPMADDPDDYVAVRAAGGELALTVSCAAVALGLVPESDYAHADPAAARAAFAPLTAALHNTVDDAAREVLRVATMAVRDTVESLIKEYRLDRRTLVLVGGRRGTGPRQGCGERPGRPGAAAAARRDRALPGVRHTGRTARRAAVAAPAPPAASGGRSRGRRAVPVARRTGAHRHLRVGQRHAGQGAGRADRVRRRRSPAAGTAPTARRSDRQPGRNDQTRPDSRRRGHRTGRSGSRRAGRADRGRPVVTAPAITGPALRRCAELAELDDTELGATFLGRQQMHAQRPAELRRRWARVALTAGRAAAQDAVLDPVADPAAWAADAGLSVVSARAGLRPGWVVVAEYVERRHEVRLHEDVLDLAERLVDRLGWREWYPAGALRSAAIAHELGHRGLHGHAARELRARLGLCTLRLGRYRRYGHVSGTPELFAHGYAQRACALGRSPLLLTFALATAAGARTGKDAG